MPLYEYQCEDCGHKFEELVSSDDQAIVCPDCKSNNTMKLVSLFSSKGIASGCSTCVPSQCSSKFT